MTDGLTEAFKIHHLVKPRNMEPNYKRIFITGASGTGKTTLAKWIDETYNIPFISTSAKEVWPKYGFKSHEDAILTSVNEIETGQRYQHELVNNRIKLVRDRSSFVIDRSLIDNYAYILLQGGFRYTKCVLEDYKQMCQFGLGYGDMIIFIRYTDDIDLENDGARIALPDYQRTVDATLDMIIKKNLINTTAISTYELNVWDLETRKKMIRRWLTQ